MRTAIYTRISQDKAEQDKHESLPGGARKKRLSRAGVNRQLKACRELAERRGWQAVAHFDDNDISAFNGKTRPGFEAMLDAAKAGEIEAIVCWHPDRLYRRIKDLQRLLDIAEDSQLQIASVNGGDIDLSTGTGEMMAIILGSVAQQESKHKGERRRDANRDRRAKGKWRNDGPRVFGYTQHGEPLEPEASAVRQAAIDVLLGRSLRSVAVEWNSRGLTTPRGAARGGTHWTNLRVRKVLLNPRYAGLVCYQGEPVEGVEGEWEQLVDAADHKALVAKLKDPDRRPASLTFEKLHMGSGVYECGHPGCGKKMYAVFPGTNRPMAYGCRPTSHVARLGEPLDEFVEAAVLALLRDTDINARLSSAEETVDVDALSARREALVTQIDELATALAQRILDLPGVERESKKLRSEIAAIDKYLGELAHRDPVAELLLKDGPDKLQEHWDACSPDMRGKIVDRLMTVTVKPTHGAKGVVIDRETGVRFIDPDHVDITPKTV